MSLEYEKTYATKLSPRKTDLLLSKVVDLRELVAFLRDPAEYTRDVRGSKRVDFELPEKVFVVGMQVSAQSGLAKGAEGGSALLEMVSGLPYVHITTVRTPAGENVVKFSGPTVTPQQVIATIRHDMDRVYLYADFTGREAAPTRFAATLLNPIAFAREILNCGVIRYRTLRSPEDERAARPVHGLAPGQIKVAATARPIRITGAVTSDEQPHGWVQIAATIRGEVRPDPETGTLGEQPLEIELDSIIADDRPGIEDADLVVSAETLTI